MYGRVGGMLETQLLEYACIRPSMMGRVSPMESNRVPAKATPKPSKPKPIKTVNTVGFCVKRMMVLVAQVLLNNLALTHTVTIRCAGSYRDNLMA
jgi:hypothetical protein